MTYKLSIRCAQIGLKKLKKDGSNHCSIDRLQNNFRDINYQVLAKMAISHQHFNRIRLYTKIFIFDEKFDFVFHTECSPPRLGRSQELSVESS